MEFHDLLSAVGMGISSSSGPLQAGRVVREYRPEWYRRGVKPDRLGTPGPTSPACERLMNAAKSSTMGGDATRGGDATMGGDAVMSRDL